MQQNLLILQIAESDSHSNIAGQQAWALHNLH
jgi:hypothetical protein